MSFNRGQLDHMARLVGLPPGLEERTVIAGVLEALDEEADAVTTSPPMVAQVPEGSVVVPAAQLQAHQSHALADADLFLDSVAEKYFPENRDAWALEFVRDPAGTIAYFETAPALRVLEQHPAPLVAGTKDDDEFYAAASTALFGH